MRFSSFDQRFFLVNFNYKDFKNSEKYQKYTIKGIVFFFPEKMFKCMHHIQEVNRNCSCKTFWSNFLVLLFERACCSYVPLHFTIRQWYGKSSFSVYSLGQIQKVLCTDNTLGLEDNTESIYFFLEICFVTTLVRLALSLLTSLLCTEGWFAKIQNPFFICKNHSRALNKFLLPKFQYNEDTI